LRAIGEPEAPKRKMIGEPKSEKIYLGKVPVMVRSKFCHLKNFSPNEITHNAKECTFD